MKLINIIPGASYPSCFFHNYTDIQYSQTCIKRSPIGYNGSGLLIQGVLNEGDKDNQIGPLGDGKSAI